MNNIQRLLAVFCLLASGPNMAMSPVPYLQKMVSTNGLPPMHARLPENPRMIKFTSGEFKPGKYGGRMRLLMGRHKDIRLMNVYGYARLVVYGQNYAFEPDILESFSVEEERIFTFKLRKGHRWSDGTLFTTDDFRYWWYDIINNKEISPFGMPPFLKVENRAPQVEFIDKYTLRFSWHKPNPFFLPALADARPEYIYAPAHYLRQYHAEYTSREHLEKKANEQGQHSWAAVHNILANSYKNNNPKLPTLEPWYITTESPAIRFLFKRNPYFHRVDELGHQLPYIDEVVINIADGKLIPAKTGAGESDLQARHLKFSDYTFLKASEERTLNKILLWQTTKGSHMALYPNLNVKDPRLRSLVRDVRFRRALSLAINRREINEVIYYGLALEGNNLVHPQSPLFVEEYALKWTQFDLVKADQLLDEMGLTKRGSGKIRLKDGIPIQIVVETAGEDSEQSDVLELVKDSWRDVGIELLTKPLQREVFRNRIFSGKTVMSVWGGIENGLPVSGMSPREFIPSSQQQLQWPMWGQFYETSGKSGELVDMSLARQLVDLNTDWLQTLFAAERRKIWDEILRIHADQQFSIGIICSVPQPVVVNRNLRNVPEKGVYNWDPGAHFGIYNPDTFWFDR